MGERMKDAQEPAQLFHRLSMKIDNDAREHGRNVWCCRATGIVLGLLVAAGATDRCHHHPDHNLHVADCRRRPDSDDCCRKALRNEQILIELLLQNAIDAEQVSSEFSLR